MTYKTSLVLVKIQISSVFCFCFLNIRFRDLGALETLTYIVIFHWTKSLLYQSGSGLMYSAVLSEQINSLLQYSIETKPAEMVLTPVQFCLLHGCQTLASKSTVCSHQVDSLKQIVPAFYNLNHSAKL